MAADAIQRLKSTVILQSLLEAEAASGGDHSLSELCVQLVGKVAPLLERIPEKMPEFTLHDPNHSAKVIELIAQILPQKVLSRLNVVELAILISAAYLHDFGMTCTSSERDAIIADNPEFRALLLSDEQREAAHQKAIDAGEHRLATRIEDQVFVEYLRRHHVERSDKYIEQHQSEFKWQGSPFGKWVRAVCRAHGEPISSLFNEADYPRDALVRNLRVNVQYLAVLLRLGDILDLDPERTPVALFEFIDPVDEKSIEEWNKHRSVIGWDITPERVVFEAECTQPSYERALRTFIGWIEDERRESLLLLARLNDEIAKHYRLDLVHPVTADRVHANGSYIYSNMRFEIDHKRVMALLGGIRLYRDPMLAVRELLQNSADAVRHRITNDPAQNLTPSIVVTLGEGVLTVEDNGIGMDEGVFKGYFIQLGRSYYTSPDFRAKPAIDPVSEFGIGALASFMIAKSIVIESRRQPENPLTPFAPILFEVPTAFDFFVQRPSMRTEIGTKVSLCLREEITLDYEDLCDIVRRVAPMLEYPITVREGSRQQVVPADSGMVAIDPMSFASLTLPTGTGLLRGVNGQLEIRRTRSGVRENSFAVAQRGFLIGGREHDHSSLMHDGDSLYDLLPKWTSAIGCINLHGEAKLTLTPDRRGAVRDKQFLALHSAIDAALLHVVREKLESMLGNSSPEEFKAFTDSLLENDVIKAGNFVGFSLSPGARELVHDLIFAEVLEADGSLRFVPLKEIFDKPKVVFTSRADWPIDSQPADVRRAIDAIVSDRLPVVVRPSRGSFNFDCFSDYLFGDVSSLYVTSLPGLVVDVAEKDFHQPPQFDGHLEVVRRLCSQNPQPAFSHQAAPNMVQTLCYNPLHPLLRPFIDGEGQAVNDNAKQLVVALDDGLTELLGDLVEQVPILFRKVGNVSGMRASRDSANSLFRGFLKRNPEFLPAAEGLFQQLWAGGQSAGLVTSGFPGFTATDVPWFWSEDLRVPS